MRDSQNLGMLSVEDDSQHQKDQEFLAKFGYKQELDRSLGFLSTFAIAFGFVSATNGFYALFYYGLDTGGPAGVFWSWPIVVFGQLMVALVFAEAASHFPLAGGVYQWAKHLMNCTWGWFTAWMFLFALLVTVAGVAFGAAPLTCGLFGWEMTRWTLFAVAVCFTLVPMALNIWGVKIMAYVNNVGTITELIGMTGLGVILIAVVLFTSKPHQGLGVLVDTAGTASGHTWGFAGAFMGAMLTSAWVMFGFDTAGSLAEETVNPSKEVPRAIIAAVIVTAVVSTIWLVGTLLAIPDMKEAVGQGAAVLPWLLRFHLGDWPARVFIIVVLAAIFVCSLSIQAAATRLLFAQSRDGMLPDSRFFGKVNVSTRTPVRAAVFVAVFCTAVLLYQDQVARVISWATVGVYVVYQMVVFASMYARSQGWPKEQAHFSLGTWGWPVSLIAFGYGVFMIINLSWPRTPGAPWYNEYLIPLSLATIFAIGVVVYFGMKAAGRDLSGGMRDLGLADVGDRSASGRPNVILLRASRRRDPDDRAGAWIRRDDSTAADVPEM